jgi:hypothetical protein
MLCYSASLKLTTGKMIQLYNMHRLGLAVGDSSSSFSHIHRHSVPSKLSHQVSKTNLNHHPR